MALIPDDIIDAVRQAVDLAELVGRYVPLRKAGRSFKACCPFHQEKTPSFHVTPERGTWKCFGCGKGGNAFTFLMEKEGVSFPEAIRQLARESGVHLPQDDDPHAAAQASWHNRLREVMERACRFYEKQLLSPEGEAARAYLVRRGIEPAMVERFRLGWAPPGWQNLLEAAQRSDTSVDDLVELGLVRRKEPEEGRPARTFDMFRGRVMFPIADTQGRVIAFGARTLGDDEPKYLNSPETPLFTKGRSVYALHLAKNEMLRTGEAAVMEGYTDVILAHQCGWPVAVAGLGTALTREQASMIARYTKRLYLVYDGDPAGLKASEKNAPVFLPEEIQTRVAILPQGEDPCDLLLRAGMPALRACLDGSREVFDHLLAAAKRQPGEAQALEAALAPLVAVTDKTRRPLYVKRVADEFLLTHEQVLDRLKEMQSAAAAAERRAPAPAAVAAAAPAPSPPRAASPPSPTEEQLVEALLGRPELCAEAAERLPVGALSHPLCRDLVERLVASYQETGLSPDVDALLGALQDPELAGFAAGLRSRGVGKSLDRQGRDCIGRLAEQHESRRLREGLSHVAETPGPGQDPCAGQDEILRRWVEFHRRRAGGT